MRGEPLHVGVIGATGRQGGAVARALLSRGVGVTAFTRDESSGAARDLAAGGARVRRVDLDDVEDLTAAMRSVPRVFAMTTMTGPRGTQGEVEQGENIVNAAGAAGVQQVVYSSVGGAERSTGVPHFESKWQVEQMLQRSEVPYSVLRPTFFMENLEPTKEDGVMVLRLPLPDGVPLQMIAVRDIGQIAANLVQREPGQTVEVVGDEPTGSQMAETIGEQAGLPARYEPLPLDALPNEDLRLMFSWFTHQPAYRGDRDATADLLGRPPTDLKGYFASTR